MTSGLKSWLVAAGAVVALARLGTAVLDTGLKDRSLKFDLVGSHSVSGTFMKLKMARQQFTVPTNFLYGPPDVNREEGGVGVARGILVRGLAPDFEPINPGNAAEFEKVTCCIRASFTIAYPDPVRVIRTLTGAWLAEVRILSQDTNNDVTHYVVDPRRTGVTLGNVGDLYIRRDGSEGTACNRLEPGHLVNIECHVFRAMPGVMVQISVPGNDEAKRGQEVAKVWAAINSWRKTL